MVDHRDVVGEAIGLVEVLRRQQHRGPARDQVLDHAPQARAGCGGPDRSSARPGTAPAVRRRASRRGPGACACRPSSSSPRWSAASLSSKRSSSSRARRLAGARPAPYSPPTIVEVLESRQVFIDGRVLAGEPEPRTPAGVSDDVEPVDPRCALVGLVRSRAPAPAWSCRRRSARAGRRQAFPGHDEVDAVERTHVAVALDDALDFDCRLAAHRGPRVTLGCGARALRPASRSVHEASGGGDASRGEGTRAGCARAGSPRGQGEPGFRAAAASCASISRCRNDGSGPRSKSEASPTPDAASRPQSPCRASAPPPRTRAASLR